MNKQEQLNLLEKIEYTDGKCCENCKHYKYSTARLSSWCTKHTAINDDNIRESGICKDFEE